METHEPITMEAEPAPAYVLPQFEAARKRRRSALDGRVRSIRRTLVAGGLIGTVAFTALAGYESRVASGATNANAGRWNQHLRRPNELRSRLIQLDHIVVNDNPCANAVVLGPVQ